jgi:mono/diheme cytochrome c family protein
MRRVSRGPGLFLSALTAALIVMMPSQAAAQDAKQGETVYNAQKCSVCHSVAGKGNKANPLDGVGAKHSAADIRAWIVDPVAMTAKTGSTKKPPMPKKWAALPAAELDALVAYMQSLK